MRESDDCATLIIVRSGLVICQQVQNSDAVINAMNERGVTFTAVLLAGGESRRMGAEKAGLIHRNGLPFWQHQLHVLEQVDPDYIMVSAPKEPAWISEDMIWVKDQEEGQGPIRGIASALKACPTTHLICLGIDVVDMPAHELKYFCTCSTNGIGLVPQTEAGWEPLAAIFPRESIDTFMRCIVKEEYALHKIIDLLQRDGMIRPYPVPEDELGFYRNINTNEEYEAWVATY